MTDEEIRREIRRQRKRKLLKRRIISLAVAVAIAAGGGFLVGNAIGNNRYEKEIKGIVPVAADKPIVKVAMSQLGNKGGEPFWSWYGFKNREEWCALFISWCEDQCGYLKSDVAPKFAIVSDGADWFVLRDQWRLMGDTPEAGDLIFFDWDQDGGRDHVGIVTAVVDDKVFTVEGNSSDLCRQKRYYLDDPAIYGYGVIKPKK
ncbi:MAG: CHAP domain-containing protein [Mogibacterium sp.]|nr:CHAP domain-containing protein [Mogibacterium sp.]MBR4090988.1 CHAP domain-containing protein [Mogibacterium sp.]